MGAFLPGPPESVLSSPRPSRALASSRHFVRAHPPLDCHASSRETGAYQGGRQPRSQARHRAETHTRPRRKGSGAARGKLLARFTELEDERTQINTQLAGLAKADAGPGDASSWTPVRCWEICWPVSRPGCSSSYTRCSTCRPSTTRTCIRSPSLTARPAPSPPSPRAADDHPGAASSGTRRSAQFSDPAQAPIRVRCTTIMDIAGTVRGWCGWRGGGLIAWRRRRRGCRAG
jgi:hypothetical protein